MIKKIIIGFVAFCFSFALQAQNHSISGVVIDAATAEVLPFTNIGVLGKEAGTVSNSEGRFTINLDGLNSKDSLFFSYVGYFPLKLSLSVLTDGMQVKLQIKALELSSFSVLSREYTPLEILDSVKKYYNKNHANGLQKQRLFMRDASYTTIHRANIDFKKSSFKAINKGFIDDFNENMPENLNVYSDYLVDRYSANNLIKLQPIEGQSLIENWNFSDEFNKGIKMLAGDLESDVRDEESYFKLRSGIFAGKLDFGSDTTFTLSDDSLHYVMSTDMLRGDINYLLRQYSTLNSKRWDFFSEYKWYNYTLRDVAIINEELAYIIDFNPEKRKGKYKGTICVSAETFALLQVEYAFDKDKEGRGVSLLGVDYLVADRSGRAIFEKGAHNYHLKYLSRVSDERFAMDRTLTLKQKQEDGWFDKTLQEVKMNIDLSVTFEQKKELLTISNETITKKQFDALEPSEVIYINKVDKYSPELWKNSSILEPTKALKEYEKQF